MEEYSLADFSTLMLRRLAESSSAGYVLLYLGGGVGDADAAEDARGGAVHVGGGSVRLMEETVTRFLNVARDTGADMLYSDYYESVAGGRFDNVAECSGMKAGGSGEALVPHPLIDCQEGAMRDDFDFGKVLVFKTSALCEAVAGMTVEYKYAGLYDLRLRMKNIIHIPEPLYVFVSQQLDSEGERQFDYVNPKNREVQIEMETVCTEHLKRIGAYLQPFSYAPGTRSAVTFPVTASVVIPVYNRVKTIGDAVRCALAQVCDFPFNVFVIDNHSTDGTSELLAELKKEVSHAPKNDHTADTHRADPTAPALEIITPTGRGLGIGGCWNLAVNSPLCGEFAVQLDSDDLYSGLDSLQKIVTALRKQDCAMLVGSYDLTDFNLNPIPPGVIDHREWTEENGRNNALRVNGLGAPRAFCTAILRKIGGFPNVSYGEDYAVGLRISREYKIGRIYDVLYHCRRWGGNSDSNLPLVRLNANNAYKDWLRTAELRARIRMNGGSGSQGMGTTDIEGECVTSNVTAL